MKVTKYWWPSLLSIGVSIGVGPRYAREQGETDAYSYYNHYTEIIPYNAYLMDATSMEIRDRFVKESADARLR